MEDSIKAVLWSLKNSIGGEVFVPKLPSYNIVDLAKAVAPDCKIKYIGLRPGEKLHEELISKNESCVITDKGNYYILHTNLGQVRNNQNYNKNNFDYSSEKNKKFLTVNQLKENIKYYYKK